MVRPLSGGSVERCAGPWHGWRWVPETAPWFDALARRSADWTCAPLDISDEASFRSALADAVERRRAWLIHPCLSPLLDSRFGLHDAQARLAFWIAVHSDRPLGVFGSIRLARDVELFGPGGGFPVAAGEHSFADLAAMMPESPGGPVPDPWGQALPDQAAIGGLAETAWWSRGSHDERAANQCRDDIRALLKTQHALRTVLPDAFGWFSGMTRVVIPLRAGEGEQFRSGSVAGIPGLVVIEITRSHLLTLEALIHETAHLHFHFCELAVPLVRPDHERLYASPLRRDPRPLRGIFLAYHALIYMCALYRDWFAATGDARCVEALANLRPLLRDAGATVAGADAGLTDSGRAFLRRCDKLAERAASVTSAAQ